MIDITGKLLPESEKLYQTLFHSMNEGLALCEIILDEDGQPYDYRHLEVNPAFERIIGIPAVQVSGKTRREFGYADPYWLELFGQVVKTGEPASREDYSSGSAKWLDLRAFSLGGRKFAFLFTDITERKRAEEVLRESKDALQKTDGSTLIMEMGIEITTRKQAEIELNQHRRRLEELVRERTRELESVNTRLQAEITERKRAEEAIEAARIEAINEKNRLQAVMDALPVGVAILDAQGGNVQSNITFEKIWGGERPSERPPVGTVNDYAAYKAWWVESGQPVQPEEWASTRVIQTGEPVVGQQMKIERFDGTYSFVLNSAAPVFDAQEQIVGSAVVIQDITELKQGEEKYRELVENANSIIIKMDRDGKLTFFNDYAQKFFGYSLDEILNKDVKILVPPVESISGRRLEDMAETILENPDEFAENTNENIRKNGEHVWISWRNKAIRDTQGNIVGNLAIGLDITERKLAEETLRETRDYLDSLFNYANAPIIVWDPQFRITRFNHAFEYLTGRKAEEVLGQEMGILFPENKREEFLAHIRHTTSEGERWEVTEIPILHRDGSVKIVLWNSAYVLAPDHKTIIAAIAQGHDISKRIRVEEALRNKQEELTAANEELQAQQEDLTSANEELQAQQEELISANEELQAQQEELNTTYQELQLQAEATNRARNEAERQATELDATLSAIAAGVLIYDHAGNIIRINEIARNLLGYSSDEYDISIEERGVRLNLCKSDGSHYELEETPLFRALRGEVIRNEEIMIAKDPEKPVWILGTLAPIHDYRHYLIGAIFTFTDITERKRMADDLLASERELLKVTLNSLGEGVIAVDQEERIIFINDTAANLTGYSGEEAAGKPLSKIFCVFDDQTSEPIALEASQKIFKVPIFVTRDVKNVPIAMNSSPIRAMNGRIIGTVIVFSDISEKLKTDQELLKTQKLESLGILAGGIAHDFNNILAAILANIQLAMLKLKKNEDIQAYLANTVETTRKASDLTKQLLTFSRGGAPVKKDASLVELIKDTTEFALRGANTKAEFAIPGDLWAASIDEGQISQVIHNLVVNANQAMPKGGVISINAQNIAIGENGRDRVRFNPGKYVKITVKDQGIGIATENLSKIFDPFFTTKKDGNGLGLATSYSIIIRHNGYIEVESLEGAGTSFFIYLPASDETVFEVETQKEVAATGAGLKILLMDDEEQILHAVGEMLKCNDYRIVLTMDGTEVIEEYQRAKASGEPFDVVVMDLTIPGGMGGQEAITHLRDIDPNIKAIVSSGYANDPIMADYEQYGFSGVVSKPYKFIELNEALNKVLERKQPTLKL